MNSNLYALLGLGVAVSFVMALKGLSAPKTARRGNLIGAFGEPSQQLLSSLIQHLKHTTTHF